MKKKKEEEEEGDEDEDEEEKAGNSIWVNTICLNASANASWIFWQSGAVQKEAWWVQAVNF